MQTLDSLMILAQQGPPEGKVDLPASILGLVKQWIGVGMSVVFVFGVVTLALMFKEISNAHNEGRAPAQIVDRGLTVAACIVGASAVGAIASFIFIDLP